jgi:hypothetical protein
VSHARQALQCLHVCRHFTAVLLQQKFTESLDGLRFLW